MTTIATRTTKTFDANKTIGKYENEMTAEELALWLELDTPSAADLARYAVYDAILAARKAEGVVNGRDWTGVLVEHPENCIGNCCVSDALWKACARECGLPTGDEPKPLRQLVVNTAIPHSSAQCPGLCRSHPLLNAGALAFRAQEDLGKTWGDIAEDDYLAERAAETPAQRDIRLKKEAVEEAAAAAGIVRYSVNKKAEKWCARGAMKFRVPRPCKYEALFAARTCAACESHVPIGQTTCQAKKGHGVCGETLAGCWSHSKGQCIYVHPDEEHWADACSGALCYDRERQVFHLRGEEVAPAARDFSALGGRAAPRREERPRHEERRYGGGGAAGGRAVGDPRPSPLGRPPRRGPQTDGW